MQRAVASKGRPLSLSKAAAIGELAASVVMTSGCGEASSQSATYPVAPLPTMADEHTRVPNIATPPDQPHSPRDATPVQMSASTPQGRPDYVIGYEDVPNQCLSVTIVDRDGNRIPAPTQDCGTTRREIWADWKYAEEADRLISETDDLIGWIERVARLCGDGAAIVSDEFAYQLERTHLDLILLEEPGMNESERLRSRYEVIDRAHSAALSTKEQLIQLCR